MRRIVVAACLLLIAAPTVTLARSSCEARAHDRRVAGTVIGAVGGAVIGNQFSHNNGALVGALGGGIVGNQLSRTNCARSEAYREPRHRRRYGADERAGPDRQADIAPSTARCAPQDQSFYNEHGDLVHRQVQVCR